MQRFDSYHDFFISYRRDGGDVWAALIYKSLTERRYQVFYDIERMDFGEFDTQLNTAIENSSCILLVLTKGMFSAARENDWVVSEIEHAKEKQKLIIPIQIKGFDCSDIPASIEYIKTRDNMLENVSTVNWDSMMSKIIAGREPKCYFRCEYYPDAGKLSNEEVEEIVEKAREIDIISVSASSLWHNLDGILIKPFLEKGNTIRMLLAQPESEFVEGIENLETAYFSETREDEISYEISRYKNKLRANSKWDLRIKLYRSEYRFPLIIAKFPKKDAECLDGCTAEESEYIKVLLGITIPPFRAAERRYNAIRAKDYPHISSQDMDCRETVQACITHFESIWNLESSIDANIFFEGEGKNGQ